jgi:uncharacterized protein (DUF58 family)
MLFRVASALNYHLPRRLTQAGMLAFAGVLLTGAVGTDLDQSVAFQAFALLFSLLALASLWVPWFRGQFAIQRQLPRLASVGQTFRYRVQVRNLSPRGYGDLELMEDLAEPHLSFERFATAMRSMRRRAFRLLPEPGLGVQVRPAVSKPVGLGNLKPHGLASAEVEITPLRRGHLRLDGVTVAARDPLGLVRAFVQIKAAQSVVVLPKRYPITRMAFSGTRHYQPGGVALASTVGESEEFVSLREYRPGDAFRRIHWRSWARTGRPIVKEYQDEFFIRHGLVLDTFARPGQELLFEEAVSVAASFACSLDTQESLLDLLFAGARSYCFTAGRGLGRSEQILEVLASVEPSRKGGFDLLSELVLRHASLLSACICIFMAWDERRQELVRELRAIGLPVLPLVVVDNGNLPKVLDEGQRVYFLKRGEIGRGLQSIGLPTL